jgi:hypothetical protein
VEAVDLVSAFLEENKYRRLHPLMAKNYSPVPGEYFILNNSPEGISHIQVMTKHNHWDLTLAIYNDGLISANINKTCSPDVLDRVELPSQKTIDLKNPKSLEVLKRLL